MRSIRRSLLGYLLILLALALGAVGALVDRFAVGAIRTREASEVDRIEQAFKLRQREAKTKFDADLLAETKALAKEVHYKTATILGQNPEARRGGGAGAAPAGSPVTGSAGAPPVPPRPFEPRPPEPPVKATDEEARLYRLRAGMLDLTPVPYPMPAALTIAALDPHRTTPPGWVAYDAPRAADRIQEVLRKTFEDDDHSGCYQFTLVFSYPGQSHRNIVTVHSARLGSDLSLDPAWLDQTQDSEPRFDDVLVLNKGEFRRVVTATVGVRPLGFGVRLPPPAPTTMPAPPSFAARPGGFRLPDILIRVFVHHMSPYSELDARLVADQNDRDEQVARVREETRMELAQFRARLILIGSGTFAALVLGGWFIVARGLAPLRKLSDAVSQVSEKDFRLPVDVAELGRELAPIHARLTQTLTLLQRAFEREKQAVADISHELRTPIASLLATIDVALRKPRTQDQYKTTLEECRLISKQLGLLVERIMTLASLDANNDHTQVCPVDVAGLVSGCAAVIRPLAGANNLTVSVHAADDLMVETDAAKLREVLMNLLHNAVEYNKPGGSIDLTARREGASAVFEVRDTGIGMTVEVREKIFERFYRADASRHATGVHAGLGLAIVKEYVTRLNGTIAVESELGTGTTFRVALPASGPPAPPSSATRAKSHRDDAVPAGS